MKWHLFGHDIYYAEPSGWDISGTGDSFAASVGVRDIPTPIPVIQAGLSLGAAWGHVRFAPNRHSDHELADYDVTGGHHLRALPRWYEGTMFGLTISAGVNTLTFQLPVGGSVSIASADLPSHGVGPVQRMPGAPSPRGEGGAPTGFLGVAVQYTGAVGTSQGRSNGAFSILQMGSNLAGLLQGKAPGWLADNLAHASDFMLGHLAYKYAGAYVSNSAIVSTQRAAFTGSAEFQMAYIGVIDMYVTEDDKDWYVHSYTLDENNNYKVFDRSFQINVPSYRINR